MNKAQEHKLKIKSSNLEAHFAMLKKEVQKENNSLNRIVSERKLAEAQLARIKKEEEKAEDTRVKTVAKTEAELNKLKTREEQIEKKVDKLDLDKSKLEVVKNEFDDYKKWELLKLEDEKDDLIQDINELTSKEKEVKVKLKKEQDGYTIFLSTMNNDIDSNNKELDTLNTELNSIKEDVSEAKNELLRVGKKKEDLDLELEKLLESKATVFKNIEDREKAVSDKERDLGVLTRRLIKMYKKDYPDYKLNF